MIMSASDITIAALAAALQSVTTGTLIVEPRKVVIEVANNDWDGHSAACVSFKGLFANDPDRFWPHLSCDIRMNPDVDYGAWLLYLVGVDRDGHEVKTGTAYNRGTYGQGCTDGCDCGRQDEAGWDARSIPCGGRSEVADKLPSEHGLVFC